MREQYGKNDSKILRIIDVNINRATEGLRVCEDVMRFILNDKKHTKELKDIRHNLREITCEIVPSYTELCKCRDIRADISTEFDPLEIKTDWESIFFANMQRTKESLRVLEEFTKLFNIDAAKKIKKLRFLVYEAEEDIIKKAKTLSDSKRNPKRKI